MHTHSYSIITPAFIPESTEDLSSKFSLLSFSDWIHVDILDGKFVKNSSWPLSPVSNISECKDLFSAKKVEVDLMVKEPLNIAVEFLNAGVKSLVFHLESTEVLDNILKLKDNYNFKLGISILNSTSLSNIYDYLDRTDFVQLMGINEIGLQGQPFDNRVLERTATLRHLFNELEISIDGSVNGETISELKGAGASRFIVGSAIVKAPDMETAYTELLKIIS